MTKQVLSIDVLPDDALLVIFDFCAPGDLPSDRYSKKRMEAWWQTLVHVCRRWRTVVFGSRRRLNLRLACAPGTPARDALDVWPALPLVISTYDFVTNGRLDDMLAVLEHSNRVCLIRLLDLSTSQIGRALAAMQVPIPELTDLALQPMSNDGPVVVPDSFLGGSASRLESLHLYNIPFPGLPKLLLSATHLVELQLVGIPHSGYFSPQTLLTALSVCTSLGHLSLGFKSPRSCPDQAGRPPPPSERAVLPLLTNFFFVGVSEYLEDLVAGIDAPVDDLGVCLVNDIVLEAPQLVQFISRTPTLKSFKDAYFSFRDDFARIVLSSRTPNKRHLRMDINCSGLERQVSFLEQICTLFMPFHPELEDLFIALWAPNRIDNIENTLWLELLRQFTAVKKFELSEQVAQYIVPALQELVGDRTINVLPALEHIILKRLELEPQAVQEGIQQFVAARQDTSHPITVN